MAEDVKSSSKIIVAVIFAVLVAVACLAYYGMRAGVDKLFNSSDSDKSDFIR